MAGRDTNIGAKRARTLREALGIDAAAPLGCILTLVEYRLELPVVIAALPEGIAGCCWRRDNAVVLWVNGTEPAVRQRFTLAHELGHVRCGHDGAIPVDTYATLSGRTTDSREVQANAFAAALLAPAAGVREIAGDDPGLDDVVEIAATYGISTIAALYRLNTLGIGSDNAALWRAIEAGEHEPLWKGRPAFEDGIALAGGLPRLSPSLAGSALAAMIAGRAPVAAAADAAGVNADALSRAAAAIGQGARPPG